MTNKYLLLVNDAWKGKSHGGGSTLSGCAGKVTKFP